MNNGGISWFARNPVAANLMMVFIIVSGLLATTTVREEVMPELELDWISIQVPYLGAAPEEVEEGVVIRIEEAIQGIDGIKEIQSTASEGSGSVMVELELGADPRRVVDEVKNNVDAITTFPVETEKPIIREMLARSRVTDIAVSGATDIFALKALAERVRDELTAMPEITQVEVYSAPPYEISIEVSEVALRRHGMTFDQVADAVRRSSLDRRAARSALMAARSCCALSARPTAAPSTRTSCSGHAPTAAGCGWATWRPWSMASPRPISKPASITGQRCWCRWSARASRARSTSRPRSRTTWNARAPGCPKASR